MLTAPALDSHAMSGYASRTNPLLLHRLPPQNGPSTSHHPYERTERSLPAQGSYQSRALPPSFAESYSPHVDKRSAQRHEPRLSNPNELDRVAIPSHYFPSVPRAATRPREASDEQMAGDSDYDRRAGPVPYGQPRTADIAGMGMGERANGADDERMEIDGDDDAAKAKKRSRTLTTAHQTSVLNALLAKVRSLRSSGVLAFLGSRASADSLPLHRDARGGRASDRNVGTSSTDMVPKCE